MFALGLDFLLYMNYHSYMSNDSNRAGTEGKNRSVRRRERTRADLLAAARKVFGERGYHEASIAEITACADVGVGTFYLHFRDKDEAFRTLLDEGFREMQTEIAEALRDARGPFLPLLVTTVFRCAYPCRDLFQIALTTRGQGPRSRLFRDQAALADSVSEVLERTQAQGLLQDYDLGVIAHLLAGMITQGIFWWFEHAEPGPEEMAHQVLLLLRQGLPEHLFHADEASC